MTLPPSGDTRDRADGDSGYHAGTFVGDVSWENNLTALVWTMTGPFL